MSDRVWIGVDVGQAGGIAVVGHDNVLVFDMPCLERGGIDGQAFRDILRGLIKIRSNCVVTLERLNGFGSPQSGFTLGRASGIVEGIFQAFEFDDLRFVDPVRWKSALGLRDPEKARGLSEKKRKEILKQMSIELAGQLFPAIKSRIEHDGISDALLIAHFGREYLSDENQVE